MSGPRFLCAIFVLLTLGKPDSSPALAGNAAAEACAAQDLIVFSLIERHGEDRSLPAQILADASMKLINARVACRDGREAEAVATYTDLNASLAAATSDR